MGFLVTDRRPTCRNPPPGLTGSAVRRRVQHLKSLQTKNTLFVTHTILVERKVRNIWQALFLRNNVLCILLLIKTYNNITTNKQTNINQITYNLLTHNNNNTNNTTTTNNNKQTHTYKQQTSSVSLLSGGGEAHVADVPPEGGDAAAPL